MIWIYLAIGCVSAYLVAGWHFAYFQGKYPRIAREEYRADLGGAVLWGVFAFFLWPIMVPLTYCVSGFAQYGCWHRRRSEPRDV